MKSLNKFSNLNFSTWKVTLLILLAYSFCDLLVGQSRNENIRMVMIGKDSTIEKARNAALNTALEAVYGNFISNDVSLIKDSILYHELIQPNGGIVMSNRNVVDIKNTSGSYISVIEVHISIENLRKMATNNNRIVDINDGDFSFKVKLQDLNEQIEVYVMSGVLGAVHEILQHSFEYKVFTGEPRSLDLANEHWEIKCEVDVMGNDYFDTCETTLAALLQALSLDSSENQTYRVLGKNVYPLDFMFNEKTDIYYLRNNNVCKSFLSLCSNIEAYARLFTVDYGQERKLGKANTCIKYITNAKNIQTNLVYHAALTNSRDKVGYFTWLDTLTITEIEKVLDFVITPSGPKYNNLLRGCYVLNDADSIHGMMIAPFDIEVENWNQAYNECATFSWNGFDDWYIPSIDELNEVYTKIYFFGLGGRQSGFHWSSSVVSNSNYVWTCDIDEYNLGKVVKKKSHIEQRGLVRPVRRF